jgi:hypothetical protein
MLDRYVAGADDAALPDVWWAIEAHLEGCASCRRRLGDTSARLSPGTVALADRVWEALAAEAALVGPDHPRRRRPWTNWATPALLPRVVTTVMVVVVAVGLDLADTAADRYPSLVLLVAPVAPLLGVAAAWSGRLDPAYELVAASSRAGLDLVLRRAAVVLAVVIPVLGVAGWLVGASPALWLVPCLAFTLAALALGEPVGLHRAATGLAVAWSVVVVGPSLVAGRSPALLDAASLPVWVAASVVAAVLLVARRRAYTGLASTR